METTWTRSALKEMKALPKAKRDAVLKAVEAYAASPFAPNPNAKPLIGSKDTVRLRVGEYRVILVRTDRIEVRAVGHRREIYR